MSYSNPQRQIVSNAPAFENLQKTISSTVSDATNLMAGAFVKKQEQDRADKKDLTTELQKILDDAAALSQNFSDASQAAESKSEIPINLQDFSAQGKKIILENKMMIRAGASSDDIAKYQGNISKVNELPQKTVDLAAWTKSFIDEAREGRANGNLANDLINSENDPNLKAIFAAASQNPNAVKYSLEKDDDWNPTIIITQIDKDGNSIGEPAKITYAMGKNAYEKGGYVPLTPDPGKIVENFKIKTQNVFETKTTTNSKGGTTQEADGRVMPGFTDTNTIKTDPNTLTTVEDPDGKMLTTIGNKIVTIKKYAKDYPNGSIEEDPGFNASVNAIAESILTNERKAYAFNNDVMAKKLGNNSKLEQTPANITNKDEWVAKFKTNFKAYQLAIIPDTQPVLDEAGKNATETVKTPKPISTGSKSKGGGGKQTEADKKRAYALERIKEVKQAGQGRVVGTKGFVKLKNGVWGFYKWKNPNNTTFDPGAYEFVPNTNKLSPDELFDLANVYAQPVGSKRPPLQVKK